LDGLKLCAFALSLSVHAGVSLELPRHIPLSATVRQLHAPFADFKEVAKQAQLPGFAPTTTIGFPRQVQFPTATSASTLPAATEPDATQQALGTLRGIAVAAAMRQVQAIKSIAAQARSEGRLELDAASNETETNVKREMEALVPSPAGEEKALQDVSKEARKAVKVMTVKSTGVGATAAVGAVASVATSVNVSGAEVAAQLRALQALAYDLAENATTAATRGEQAAKKAIEWAAKLPAEEGKRVTNLTNRALNVSLRLQSEANEAGYLNRLIGNEAAMIDDSSMEVIKRSDHAISMAKEVVRQATANARAVKAVADMTQQVSLGEAESDNIAIEENPFR